MKKKFNYYQFQDFSNTSKPVFVWEHILVALNFSCGLTPIVYTITSILRQNYSQLISGSLSWIAGSKFQDYALLIGLVVLFFTAYFIVYLLSCLIIKRKGKKTEKAFRVLLALSTLPAWIWVGGLLLTESFSLYYLLLLSFSSTVSLLVIIFVGVALIGNLQFSSQQEFLDCIGTSTLSVIGAGMASISIALAIGRINLDWQFKSAKITFILALLMAFISFIVVIFLWLYRSDRTTQILQRIRLFILSIQALLPTSFFILLPPPWRNEQGKFYGYPINSSLLFLITILIIIAYLDLLKRITVKSNDNNSLIKSALSPFCLSGLLLLLKLPPITMNSITSDDYHFGEFLLPWWLWKNFGYVPFQDYVPARGLVNYIPGFLAEVFLDGTASSYTPANGIRALLFLLIGFVVVSRSIGVMPAFLAFLLMPLADGISEIDILSTAVLCLLCELFLQQKPTLWLYIWATLITILFLFAPGQGGLLIIATSPLVIVALWRAFIQEKKKLLVYFLAGTFLSVLLFIFTPIDEMIFGAGRYLKEQSSINSIAHGVEWSNSLGVWSNPLTTFKHSNSINYWLWEIIRSSWILVGIIAGLIIWRAILMPYLPESKRSLIFSIPITILVIIFIPRAAGRIDSTILSRLGIASTWSLCLLLPILLFSIYNYLKNPLILLLVAFAGSLLSPISDLPRTVFQQPSTVSSAVSNSVKNIPVDMRRLGNTIVNYHQLKRLQSIQSVLNKILLPGETYLDLTNRNAQYFYLGYPPPIEVGAFYNLVHNNQQLRSLDKLKEIAPPIVLASADNLLFDGGTVALRSPLIYRYVVENYIPIKVDSFVYMVTGDRLVKLKMPVDYDVQKYNEKQFSLLDEVFRMDNLKALPISWGRSFHTLKSQIRLVSPINSEHNLLLHSVKSIGTDTYQISGKHPYITFNIETLKIKGRDAGLLAFDFACSNSKRQYELKIYWSSKSYPSTEATVVSFMGENGKLLVPLDAAPRWLLAEDINSIGLDITDASACKTFSLSNITLFQRAIVK